MDAAWLTTATPVDPAGPWQARMTSGTVDVREKPGCQRDMRTHGLANLVDGGAWLHRVTHKPSAQHSSHGTQVDVQGGQAGSRAHQRRHDFTVIRQPRCEWRPFDQPRHIPALRDIGLSRAKRQQAGMNFRQSKCDLDEGPVGGRIGDHGCIVTGVAIAREHCIDGAPHTGSEGQLACRGKRLQTLLCSAQVDRRAMTRSASPCAVLLHGGAVSRCQWRGLAVPFSI